MDILDATIITSTYVQGTWVSNFAHNPAEDKTFFCLYNYQGVIRTQNTLSFYLIGWEAVPEEVIVIEEPPIIPRVSSNLPPPITAITTHNSISGDFYSDYDRRNWVAWSKIGEIDFNRDLTNEAGFSPMPWQGWVYQIKSLGKNGIVYGANGITAMVPNEVSALKHTTPTFGKEQIHFTGILGKNTVCGDNKVHYFIDTIGQLCQLTAQGVKVLGYSEYLFPMKFMGKPIIMLYEHHKQWVYICNGTVGYIFTPMGLGGGPKNITGLVYLNEKPLIASAGDLEIDIPWLTTELFDLGNRDNKTLYQLAVSTSTPELLEGMVVYRYDIKLPYQQTTWRNFDKGGNCFFNVAGVEFRTHLRAKALTDLVIDDYIIYMRLFDRTLKQEAFPGGQ